MARVGLIHGLGGTAATMAPLAAALRDAGHECVAVTLPGHGTSAEALEGVGWADWLAAVPEVEAVVGQSMGGALALAAAAVRGSAVRLVVAVNAPAPDPDALDGLEWRQSRGHDWVDGPPLADGEEGYARFPITALIEMVQGGLAVDAAAVTARVVLVNSDDDDVVDPASAGVWAAALAAGATTVEQVVLPGGSHVATMGPAASHLADIVLTALTALASP